MKRSKICALIASMLTFTVTGCSEPDLSLIQLSGDRAESQSNGIKIENVSVKAYKDSEEANPILSNIFCADPTAVEYEGRLYVYGTNDNQQYEAVGEKGKNTYEKIKSFVVVSTDDMVNWTYHGIINTEEIAPWIYASWAPSIVSREEADGRTHFYLYFSNSGAGVGVLTATNPLGPWSDPIGKPLVDGKTPTLGECDAPFDPGVCIDENGIGWLSFGGGDGEKSGSEYMPGNSRIVKLGDDMVSLASDISEIRAPYHFEANELNYINGTWVYTYNTSWKQRIEWEFSGIERPSQCSMSYMTSTDPLNPESWVYRDYYFKNPGDFGMEYSNNHTHLHKFKDKYYLFYHTLILNKAMGYNGGFRSLCVNEITVNENDIAIERTTGTRTGTAQIQNLNPFIVNQAETAFTTADISFEQDLNGDGISVKGTSDGAWVLVKGVDFEKGASVFAAKVKGKGRIEVRADDINSEAVTFIEFNCGEDDYKVITSQIKNKLKGIHDIYFILSAPDINFDEWQFLK